jgi:predicted GNAT family acetyltransferase
MIDVKRTDDAAAFLAQAEELLLADEARHNLLLGIAGMVRDSPDIYPLRSFWLVRHGSQVVGAAMRTPPYNLILARPSLPAALEALAGAVSEELPGVVGAVPESEEFAELWAALAGARARTNMRQGVYQLEQVEPLSAVPGSPRVATADDRELALRWWIAFGDEVLHEGGPGRENAGPMIDHRLASPRAGILLWEDEGEPVSLAGWGATALTAELSQRLLDGRLFEGGRRFCFLYTDLANPTSNAIYERIGYRRVAESAEVVFDRD